MHYDNCIEYSKNKNNKDNEHSKTKYHTDSESRAKGLSI